ncbi:MAG: tetratricopeptide repeat protein [Bacteroidia bacterium]|jgi:tetratricopeptide (TPR) repeat protein
MNIRILLASLLSAMLLLASCGNEQSSNDTVNKLDTSKIYAPELQKINAEIAANSNDPDLYHKRAKYYFDHKNFDAGFEDMKKVIMRDSSKAEYFITLSDLYFVTNQTANAKSALEKCLSIDPKNVNAMLKLGEIYFYIQKYDKTFEYINKALKIDKYNSKAYFMKGMAYKEMKDTAKAISSMQTAVEQDQTFYNAYMQLGLLTAAKKDPIALQYYGNALRIQPNSEEAWYAIGKFDQDSENWEKAKEAYKVVIKINPKNKNAYFNLGAIDIADKKASAESIQSFNDAIKIDPAYVEAYYGRAVAYQMTGAKEKAITDYRACLTINPNFEPAQTALKELGIK